MFKYIVIGLASLAMLAGCSTDQSKGPTYPVVGTVDQKQMQKAADTARLTYYALLNLAAEYASLPRCGSPGAGTLCSSQPLVTEMRRYAAAAGTATKGAVDIANNPTNTPIAIANAVSDAQRAVEVLRTAVAKVKPADAAAAGK